MLFNRDALISCIRHVHAGGLVEEAVFRDHFEVRALTRPGTLLVMADGLPDTEPLPHPVGLGDLGRLLRALETMTTSDEAHIVLSFDTEAARLTMGSMYGGAVYMNTLLPETISTQVLSDTVDWIWSLVEGAASVPLTPTFIHAVLRSIPVVDAAVVTICVRPSRSWVVVGSESRAHHRFPFPFAQLAVVEPFDVTLEAQLFATVLKQVTDFTESELIVSGPDGYLAIKEGVYRYVISPVEIDRPPIEWPIRSGSAAAETGEAQDEEAGA